MIQGHGYDKSDVFFIGDSASNDDVASNQALSGASEKMLRQLCNASGIKLDQCYLTLYIKDKLPGYGYSKKRNAQLIADARAKIAPYKFEDILLDEIRGINPRVIVPLGNLSLKFLTGEKPIDKFRGSILKPIPDYQLPDLARVIPTFSPLHIFEKWSRFPIVQVDFQTKIGPQSLLPSFPETKCLLWIAKTGGEVHNYFKRNRDKEWCTLDIETYFGLTTCISFSFDGFEAVSIPFSDPEISIADRTLMIYEIAKFLAGPCRKVGQNIKYDSTILERFGFRVSNITDDTMLAAHTIYPELPKGLDFLTSIYTSFPYYKDEGKESVSFPPDQKHLLYNAKDALVTYQVYQKQREELDELGLREFYDTKVMPLFFLYKKIDKRGIRVDAERKERLIAKYETLLDITHRELEATINHPINPNSPKQVAELVYKELKYPARVKQSHETGEKGYNTGEEILEELAILRGDECKLGIAGRDILYQIIACRKFAKVLDFLQTPIHPDGRLRTSYKLHGTETGRTSGSKTIDSWLTLNGDKLSSTYLGSSFQTIPKHGFQVGENIYGDDLRSMFVPSSGYVFIEVDQSQAEARHVALLSQDYELLALFDKADFKYNKYGLKDDIHVITATWVTGKTFEEITKQDRQDYGKKPRHAGNYDMGAARLALLAHISYEKAKIALDKFHSSSPKIRGIFHNDIINAIKRTRCLVTPYGRRRDFLNKVDSNLFKEAFAYIPQSATSDHQKFAMLRVDERIPDVAFLAESHDSTLAEVLVEETERYMSIFQEELLKPIDYRTCTLSRDYQLVIPVEFSRGENLGEMEPVKLCQ